MLSISISILGFGLYYIGIMHVAAIALSPSVLYSKDVSIWTLIISDHFQQQWSLSLGEFGLAYMSLLVQNIL